MNARIESPLIPAVLLGMIISANAGIAAVETSSAADTQRQNLAINKALETAIPFRREVESYLRYHNGFPASNADAGLGPPESYKNPDVGQVALGHDGIIQIMLTASSGKDGGVIVLTPTRPSADDYRVDWKCASADYSTISDATLGNCEYTKLP
jgi:hypothetical protein